ncbi:MAG: hypothetical protein ACRC2V_10150, partial [Xenococcaceae cyanobacterium]
LLTGKKPQDLYSSHNSSWNWRDKVKVSSSLAKVLEKMLAHNPADRYQSATDVLKAIQTQENSGIRSVISRINTLVLAPNRNNSIVDPEERFIQIADKVRQNLVWALGQSWTLIKNSFAFLGKFVTQKLAKNSSNNHQNGSNGKIQQAGFKRFATLIAGAILIPGVLAFTAVTGLMSKFKLPEFPSISFQNKEQERQIKINQRLQALKIDSGSFYQQVDRIFYRKYPQLKGVQLSDRPQHKKYREKWYQIAEDLLKQQN